MGYNHSVSAKARLGEGSKKKKKKALKCPHCSCPAMGIHGMQHQRRKSRSPLLDIAMWVCELKTHNREPDWFLFQSGFFFNCSFIDNERRGLRPVSGCADSQKRDLEWSNTPILLGNDQYKGRSKSSQLKLKDPSLPPKKFWEYFCFTTNQMRNQAVQAQLEDVQK